MDHGLLAVDILAGLHRVYAGLLVPVVGRADDDCVHITAGEDFTVVAGGEEVVAPQLLGVNEAAIVAVGDGHQLDAGHLERRLGIALALAARADERDLNAVVGGDRAACFAGHGGQGMEPRTQQRGGGCGSRRS